MMVSVCLEGRGAAKRPMRPSVGQVGPVSSPTAVTAPHPIFPHPTDKEDGAKKRTMMYYVNDGIYGSFTTILHGSRHVPSLHKVRAQRCFHHPGNTGKLQYQIMCLCFLICSHLFTVSGHICVSFINYLLNVSSQKPTTEERMYPCSIWGQTCHGTDRIVEQCILPDLQVGEWLLFHNMGAYTVSCSTTFNGFQKPDIHYVISRSVWYVPKYKTFSVIFLLICSI